MADIGEFRYKKINSPNLNENFVEHNKRDVIVMTSDLLFCFVLSLKSVFAILDIDKYKGIKYFIGK
jgi:hypothetical protein